MLPWKVGFKKKEVKVGGGRLLATGKELMSSNWSKRERVMKSRSLGRAPDPSEIKPVFL